MQLRIAGARAAFLDLRIGAGIEGGRVAHDDVDAGPGKAAVLVGDDEGIGSGNVDHDVARSGTGGPLVLTVRVAV